MQWLKLNRTWFIVIGLLIVVSLPTILPLLHHGFFQTDDGDWMIIRFSAFYQALHDGQFPVRFLQRLNFDYGYPVATFLYPGFMYAGIFFHLLKIGFVDTIKIILGGSLIGTTVFIYLWLQRVFKNKSASALGAIASLYLPYHLYDVYTRGSVGEIFALVWVAFILWMIERKSFLFVSIGIGLLLIAHNTIALLFLPFLFLYAILRNCFPLKKLIMTFLVGILLAAFFVIPAILELPFTSFSQIKIANPLQHFANLQLIGISTLVIFFLSLVFIFLKKKVYQNSKLLIWFMVAVTALTIILGSSLSSIFWQFIPSAFIQFPFRLLSYLVFTTAFLSAFILSEIKQQIIVLICFSIVIIFSAWTFIQPKIYVDHGEGYYFTNDATTTVQDEYMPVWVKEKPLQRAEKKVLIIKGKGEIGNVVYNNRTVTFTVNAKENIAVRINTIYWPGWKVFIDNTEAPISYNNPNGAIEFPISKGDHQVRAAFGETSVRIVADIISLMSFCVLLIIKFRFRKY